MAEVSECVPGWAAGGSLLLVPATGFPLTQQQTVGDLAEPDKHDS